MALRIALVVAVVALIHSQASGQLSRKCTCHPEGGHEEEVGYKAGPVWGTLHQQHDILGFPTPITYNGGVDFVNSQGHGLSGNVLLESGKGGHGTVRGDFPIVNNPIHKVEGFAQIDRNLNKNLNPVGPEKNTFGVKYENANGATASFTQAETHGNPAVKTITTSIPVVNSGDHVVKITGENTIGQQQTLGVKYENQGNDATASLSGTQKNVGPARGTAEASISIRNVGPATVTIDGKTTFGHGMKPDSQVGVQVSIPLN